MWYRWWGYMLRSYVLWSYSKMRRAFRQGKKRTLPSGVFRLRFAPVPPKQPAGLSSSPPNARGQVPLSDSCPRST